MIIYDSNVVSMLYSGVIHSQKEQMGYYRMSDKFKCLVSDGVVWLVTNITSIEEGIFYRRHI